MGGSDSDLRHSNSNQNSPSCLRNGFFKLENFGLPRLTLDITRLESFLNLPSIRSTDALAETDGGTVERLEKFFETHASLCGHFKDPCSYDDGEK